MLPVSRTHLQITLVVHTQQVLVREARGSPGIAGLAGEDPFIWLIEMVRAYRTLRNWLLEWCSQQRVTLSPRRCVPGPAAQECFVGYRRWPQYSSTRNDWPSSDQTLECHDMLLTHNVLRIGKTPVNGCWPEINIKCNDSYDTLLCAVRTKHVRTARGTVMVTCDLFSESPVSWLDSSPQVGNTCDIL